MDSPFHCIRDELGQHVGKTTHTLKSLTLSKIKDDTDQNNSMLSQFFTFSFPKFLNRTKMKGNYKDIFRGHNSLTIPLF